MRRISGIFLSKFPAYILLMGSFLFLSRSEAGFANAKLKNESIQIKNAFQEPVQLYHSRFSRLLSDSDLFQKSFREVDARFIGPIANPIAAMLRSQAFPESIESNTLPMPKKAKLYERMLSSFFTPEFFSEIRAGLLRQGSQEIQSLVDFNNTLSFRMYSLKTNPTLKRASYVSTTKNMVLLKPVVDACRTDLLTFYSTMMGAVGGYGALHAKALVITAGMMYEALLSKPYTDAFTKSFKIDSNIELARGTDRIERPTPYSPGIRSFAFGINIIYGSMITLTSDKIEGLSATELMEQISKSPDRKRNGLVAQLSLKGVTAFFEPFAVLGIGWKGGALKKMRGNKLALHSDLNSFLKQERDICTNRFVKNTGFSLSFIRCRGCPLALGESRSNTPNAGGSLLSPLQILIELFNETYQKVYKSLQVSE